MIELGEPERTMRDGVPDGPGMCCGTCRWFIPDRTVRGVDIGVCGEDVRDGRMAVAAETDGACSRWEEAEEC